MEHHCSGGFRKVPRRPKTKLTWFGFGFPPGGHFKPARKEPKGPKGRAGVGPCRLAATARYLGFGPVFTNPNGFLGPVIPTQGLSTLWGPGVRWFLVRGFFPAKFSPKLGARVLPGKKGITKGLIPNRLGPGPEKKTKNGLWAPVFLGLQPRKRAGRSWQLFPGTKTGRLIINIHTQ